MSVNKSNMNCDVCGDKALCKNFAANVCESCKAFFRRAIRLNKKYTCPSVNKCVVNKVTRTSCRLCRLNKCFAVGMRPEFVRSNNENQIRRQNIELNRLRHYISGDNSVVSSPVFLAADVSTHSHNSIESQDFLSEIIDKTIGISAEEMTQQITEIEINSVQESQELIITPVIRPLDNHNDWNCLETNRIAELLSATKIFDYNLPSNTVSVNHFHEMVRNYNNRFEDFLSDIVRFSKNLNGFATICSDDQLSLLKSGGIDVVLLREAVYYNNEVDTYLLKMDTQNTIVYTSDIFKLDKVAYYPRFKLFMDKFVPLCKQDPIIVDLLTAIILFNPNRPHLKHRDIVKLEQQLYIYLLQRYLLLKYGSECESHSYLLNVLQMSTDVIALGGMQRTYCRDEVFREVIPYCGQLTREIFDLNEYT